MQSHIFVIFGASGDLTVRKLIPAIYELYSGGFLPEHFACGTAVFLPEWHVRPPAPDRLNSAVIQQAHCGTIGRRVLEVHR